MPVEDLREHRQDIVVRHALRHHFFQRTAIERHDIERPRFGATVIDNRDDVVVPVAQREHDFILKSLQAARGGLVGIDDLEREVLALVVSHFVNDARTALSQHSPDGVLAERGGVDGRSGSFSHEPEF